MPSKEQFKGRRASIGSWRRKAEQLELGVVPDSVRKQREINAGAGSLSPFQYSHPSP